MHPELLRKAEVSGASIIMYCWYMKEAPPVPGGVQRALGAVLLLPDAWSLGLLRLSLAFFGGRAVFSVFTAYAAGLHVVNKDPPAMLLFIQPHGAKAVAAVPEPVVAHIAVGGFVADEQHLVFIAGDLRFHLGPEGGLGDLPQDLGVGLRASEVGAAAGPELAEVERVVPALVIELAQQLAVQGDAEDFGSAAAHPKDAVAQALAGEIADQVIGGEPHPGRGEVAAPVLVGVTVAGLRFDPILLAIEPDPAAERGLHALGVPEHLKGVEGAKKLGSPIACVIGHLLVDPQVPLHFSCVAHPLGVRGGLLGRDMDTALDAGFGADAVVSHQVQRCVHEDGDFTPGKETVELALFLAPETCIHHAVGRAAAGIAPLWVVPDQHRLLLGQSRIAEEIFDVKRLACSGFGVLGGEGVPPPIVALFCQGTFEHTVVPGNVTFIHGVVPRLCLVLVPHRRRGRTFSLVYYK